MNKDLEYINKFKGITINKVCKDLGIDPSNLYRGNMNSEYVHRIRVELDNRLKELNKTTKIYKSRRKRIKKKKGK